MENFNLFIETVVNVTNHTYPNYYLQVLWEVFTLKLSKKATRV